MSVLLRTCGPTSRPQPPREGSLRHPHVTEEEAETEADDDKDNEGEQYDAPELR